MSNKRIALVTGANQGVGRQVAKELVANGLIVLVGSRNIARGVPAAKEIGQGAITLADPAHHYRPSFSVVYPASKAALNAVTLAMMIELECTGIKVNLVSPGFTKTNLNGFEGTASLEEGSREVVRVVMLGPSGPTGTFTRWENQTIPW